MQYSNKPIKLLDCFGHGKQLETELILVEGDSASLAASKMRNAQLQAVLPMQGKPMNALKATPQKVLENPLFIALIESIGAGVGEHFELAKCRYKRVILLMDPDADGIHCGALMLLFFYKWMRPLLESGRVEMVRPPVGEVTNMQTNITQYAYTDAQFFALCESEKTDKNQTINTLKYRGLAGIQSNQLAQTCINPATRKASIMGIKDAEMALAIFGGV